MKAIMDMRIYVEVKDEKLENVGNMIDLAVQGACDKLTIDATMTAVNDYEEVILFDEDISDQILHMLCVTK